MPYKRKDPLEVFRNFTDKAKPSQLYFVETDCAERHIKIGVAANVRARMNKMQMDNPYTLILIKRVPDSAHLEAEIHARFDEDRIAGEWFRRTDALLDYIAGLEGSLYLETDEATKPTRFKRFQPFPADAKSVRVTEMRPGVRRIFRGCVPVYVDDVSSSLAARSASGRERGGCREDLWIGQREIGHG